MIREQSDILPFFCIVMMKKKEMRKWKIHINFVIPSILKNKIKESESQVSIEIQLLI